MPVVCNSETAFFGGLIHKSKSVLFEIEVNQLVGSSIAAPGYPEFSHLLQKLSITPREPLSDVDTFVRFFKYGDFPRFGLLLNVIRLKQEN